MAPAMVFVSSAWRFPTGPNAPPSSEAVSAFEYIPGKTNGKA